MSTAFLNDRRTFATIEMQDIQDTEGGVALSAAVRLTAGVQNWSISPIGRNVVRVGGGNRAGFPVPGRLLDLTATLSLVTLQPEMVQNIGGYYKFEFQDTLESISRKVGGDAVSPFPAISQAFLDIEIAGMLDNVNLGDFDAGSDEPPMTVYTYQLTRLLIAKHGQSGNRVGGAMIDIDILNEIFQQNGKDMFPTAPEG